MNKMCLAMLAFAVGCGDGENLHQRHTPAPGPVLVSKTTTVLANSTDPTVAPSQDGRLELEFLPQAFDADVQVKITEGIVSPVPALTVGNVYRVEMIPMGASSPTLHEPVEMRFGVSGADLSSAGGEYNLGIGYREATSGDFDSVVPHYGYDESDHTLHYKTSTFSDFGVVNKRDYDACVCNQTAGTCDADCSYCDLDCVPSTYPRCVDSGSNSTGCEDSGLSCQSYGGVCLESCSDGCYVNPDYSCNIEMMVCLKRCADDSECAQGECCTDWGMGGECFPADWCSNE